MDEITFELNEGAKLPCYGSELASGMDIRAIPNRGDCLSYLNADCKWVSAKPGSYILPRGRVTKIPTGVKVELPSYLEIQVRSRSGLASKGILVANSPGTVDSDYRGEICVLLYNTNSYDVEIEGNDRIAQLVPALVTRVVPKEGKLSTQTKRGEGGFGSTGTK